jgi:hypothetical protein
MTSKLDQLIAKYSRSDGATIVGDMGAMPNVADNTVVPCREPIARPSTLGDPNGAARVVGDQVSGMPRVERNPAPPALGPIEKLTNTKTQLPGRKGGEP